MIQRPVRKASKHSVPRDRAHPQRPPRHRLHPEDQITIDQFVAAAKADSEILPKAKAESLENFALSLKQPMEGIIIDRMEHNEGLVSRYLNDAYFQKALFELMARRLHHEIKAAA